MASLGHQRARSLLAAYALDAVDSIERELVVEHLSRCDMCAIELLSLREAAAEIDRAQPRPAERVWDAIASRIAKPAAPTDPVVLTGTGTVVTRQRLQANPRLQADLEVERLTAEATRQLLWIDTALDAVNVVVALVEALGGSVVPAGIAPDGVPDAIPVDISFGACEPLLPVAPPMSVARMYLEEQLPGVLEDARRAVAIARSRRRHR